MSSDIRYNHRDDRDRDQHPHPHPHPHPHQRHPQEDVQNSMHRQTRNHEEGRPSCRRDRSRSRSNSSETKERRAGNRDKLEQERRERMSRLRMENDEEERRMVQSEQPTEEEKVARPQEEFVRVNEEELAELDEDEQMRRLLGFSGGFATTKGKAVKDNSSSAAQGAAGKNKARKYRQYMNRKGGFNRPLDKMS